MPRLSPCWLTSTVLDLAKTFVANNYKRDSQEKMWDRLPILADALMDACCDNEEILNHLKDVKLHVPPVSYYRSGCWQGQCWVLNLLLGRDQPLVASVRYAYTHDSRLVEDLQVLNPGGWFGRCYVVSSGGCYDPPAYVVEAQHECDAEEEFIESDYGIAERLDADDPGVRDYGYRVRPGDIIGGITIDRDGWMNLMGEYSDKELMEPSTTGGGTYYDGQNISVSQVRSVLYFGPGLPEEGVTPPDYANSRECLQCNRQVYARRMHTGNDPEEYCSEECELEAFAVPED